MMYMEWDDSLSVGLKTIDDQHKILIGLINDLGVAMRERKTSEELGKIIKGLLDYTKDHFAFEEEWFERYDYEDRVAHIVTHRKFVSKIADFNMDFKSGKMMLSIEIMDFLSKWLVEHIKGTDTQYVPFMKENGMK